MTLSGNLARALCAFCVFGVASSLRAQPPRWKGVVELTIGGADASDDATFGQTTCVALDADGRIFVGDRQDQQIRVFSPSGAFVRRIGRKGSGPMEFKGLASFTFAKDGILWVRDEGNARMLALDVRGTEVKNVKTVALTKWTGGSQIPVYFDKEGAIVDEAGFFDPVQKTFRPLRLRHGMSGTVLRTDTLITPEGAYAGMHRVAKMQKDAAGREIGISENYYYQPYGPYWIRSYGPDGFRAEVVTSRYEVVIYDSDNRVQRTIKRAVAPVALSARERRHADSAIAEGKGTLPFGVPSAKAPIIGLWWSHDGALWIERVVADGQPREADVYDANGKWIAVAEWPRAIDLYNGRAWVVDKAVVAVTTDKSDDTERIVRLRFH